jgi:hypothetical protein
MPENITIALSQQQFDDLVYLVARSQECFREKQADVQRVFTADDPKGRELQAAWQARESLAAALQDLLHASHVRSLDRSHTRRKRHVR